MTEPGRGAPAQSPWGDPAPPPRPPGRDREVRRPGPPARGRPGPARPAPETSGWARIRAAVVLTVIAVAIGVSIALTLSLVIWGIATAIHHAANN